MPIPTQGGPTGERIALLFKVNLMIKDMEADRDLHFLTPAVCLDEKASSSNAHLSPLLWIQPPH